MPEPDAQAISVTGESGRRLVWNEGGLLESDAADSTGSHFRVEVLTPVRHSSPDPALRACSRPGPTSTPQSTAIKVRVMTLFTACIATGTHRERVCS